MKKWTAFVLLIILPVLVRAGNFDIALGFGAVRNTGTLGTAFLPNEGGSTSPAASLRALYNINRNWQVGVSVGYIPLSYKAVYYPLMFSDLFFPGPQGAVEAYDYYAKPAIPIQVEANYKFSLGKFELYSGLSAGYFIQYNAYYGGFIADAYNPYGGAGMVGGMQTGGNWFFVPWCGVNVQMAASYYEPYNILAFPVTAGVRFRL